MTSRERVDRRLAAIRAADVAGYSRLMGEDGVGNMTRDAEQDYFVDGIVGIATGLVISGDREVSREVIMGRAGRAASGFAALGVGAGDAIAVVLRNDFPFFEASYAAQRLGAYCVPVNWHGKTSEIAYVLRDCGAKAVLAHSDLLPQVAPAVPEGVSLLVVSTPPEIAAAYGTPGELS